VKLALTTAFRVRDHSPRAPAESDFLRFWERDGASVVVLANGYSDGFSSYFADASRLVLDELARVLAPSRASLQQALDGAFIAARRRLLAETPRLMTEHHLHAGPGSDWPDEHPDAVLLALVSRGSETVAAWLGADELWHFRDGALLQATTPHTLRERHRDEAPGTIEQLPHVLCRSLVLQSCPEDTPSVLHLDLRAGDRLILLNWHSARHEGAMATARELARRSARELADAVANIAFEEGKASYVAIAVLDCGGA